MSLNSFVISCRPGKNLRAWKVQARRVAAVDLPRRGNLIHASYAGGAVGRAFAGRQGEVIEWCG
jgi:hypothetical protein